MRLNEEIAVLLKKISEIEEERENALANTLKNDENTESL